MCEGGAAPTVIGNVELAVGLDASGTVLWRTESFDPTQLVVGRDGPMFVAASGI